MDDQIDRLYKRLGREAEAGGYHLNPDVGFAKDLIRGLLANNERYGYMACPCRLASGRRDEDSDIVCPCDYRDPDLDDYGACYCGLYVSGAVKRGEQRLKSIPERRSGPGARARKEEKAGGGITDSLSQPVWRCKVCGYLCAREHPPEVCPICKVPRDRFERFM